MSSLSTPGCYRTPLSRDSIRLLRLFPHEDNKAPIECQLFHYSLRELEVRTHPYDALSYAWGDQAEAQSIFIREQSSTSKQSLPVTDNLHAALSRLRYAYLDRFLWIDAVCINQEDNLEKEQQIQIMAKIYGLANRVVVWLGKLADKSDRALQALRDSGNSESGHTLDQDSNQAISALLQRSWFQRIWVWDYI
jgi:hypothetical protein